MSHDDQLQKKVLAALAWEPSVTPAHIGVIAKDGVVTLSGHVESYAEKKAVEVAVEQIKGVKAIADELEVRLVMNDERSDEDIAEAAVHRLAWDVSVPSDAIKVRVEKGRITLSGEVKWFYQREAAEQDVRRLIGVKGVSNKITIKPSVDVSNLSDDITHALNRSWFFDPITVNVSADGGKVRLTGTVDNLRDRQTAAATAWCAPGVTDVENDIVVV